jgi:hypothetical protein
VQLALVAGIICSTPVIPALDRRIQLFLGDRPAGLYIYALLRITTVLLLFLGCLPLMIADTYNPFIYFRF